MKFKHLLLALAVPAVAFLASCGGETDDSAPKPTITFNTQAGFVFSDKNLTPDSPIMIGIVATSNDNKLKEIRVQLSTNGGATTTVYDSVVNSKTTTYTYNFKVTGAVGDKLKYTFVAVDDNGETASVSLTITIVLPPSPLELIQNQQVYNALGTGIAAYDLNNSSPVPQNDPNTIKDIKDLTDVNVTNPAKFAQAWGSGNGAKFVKVTVDDYNNAASTDDLLDLWNTKGGSSASTVSNIAKGEYILIKTGQPSVGFPYYVVKIEDVITTTTVGDNNDRIVFSYKKISL